MRNNEWILASLGLLGIVIADTYPAVAGMENVCFCLHRKPAFAPIEAVPSLCDDPSTATIEPNYSPNFDSLSCDHYTVTAPLGASAVYVVIARGGPEGIGATSFGINYAGGIPDHEGISPSLIEWTSCANGLMFPSDGGFGDFPASGGGLRITWGLPTACANQMMGSWGVHAVVGCLYVYAYASDVLKLTPNDGPFNGPELVVVDCSQVVTDLPPGDWPSILARLQFGTGNNAYNPCNGVVPVQPSTWGKLKHLYK